MPKKTRTIVTDLLSGGKNRKQIFKSSCCAFYQIKGCTSIDFIHSFSKYLSYNYCVLGPSQSPILSAGNRGFRRMGKTCSLEWNTF